MISDGRRLLESSVACCCMLRPELASRIDIDINDFDYLPARAVILSIREAHVYDLALAKDYIERHRLNVSLSSITELVMLPSAAGAESYITRLKSRIILDKKENLRLEAQRRLEDKSQSAAEVAAWLKEREAAIDAAYNDQAAEGSLLMAACEYIDNIEHGVEQSPLLPTRWAELDEMHGGGLLPNELVILAARPSCGKTAAALQIALGCGERVCLFSLEMSQKQLVARLLAAIARQNTKMASRNPNALSSAQRERFLAAAPILMEATDRIRVYDTSDQTIETIRTSARREVANGAKLVIIDYLQLITLSTGRDNREQEVSKISRALKNMSKELNVPVIVLAQLNRACEAENRVPRLSDLRESGSIEQDANSVIFLHDSLKRDNRGRKVIRMILAKGRDVGVGYVDTAFNADAQTFETFIEVS